MAPPVAAAFTMLLCTMIRNETNYLVEWIEFHKLQGWDEVRIYDNTQPHDQTPSITTTLKKTYGEDLLAARITVENIRTRVVGGQIEAFQKCTAYGEKMNHEWVAIHDLDEFHFSPMRFTVKEYAGYVMRESPNTTQVHVHQFRYGPRGRQTPITLPDLLIEDQVWRAASWVLGEKVAQKAAIEGPLQHVCDECTDSRMKAWQKHGHRDSLHMVKVCSQYKSKNQFKTRRDCTHDGLEQKTMFRTKRGCVGWIHYGQKCTGEQMWADPNHLRGNHYYLRSIEEGIRKAKYFGDPVLSGSSFVSTGSAQFIETVFDASILAWVPEFKKRLKLLLGGTETMDGHDIGGLGILRGNMETSDAPGSSTSGGRYNLKHRIEARMQGAEYLNATIDIADLK